VSYGCGGSLLASASSDGTVRLWDTTLIARNGVLIGHTTYVYDVAFRPVARPSSLAPRPPADEVASAGWDGKVLLWDPTTGRQTAELPHQSLVVSALAYSPDGRKLAVAVRKEGVWLWDLATRKPTHLWKGLAGDWKGDTHVAFNPEGTLLAGGSLEGPVRLWNPETGKEMAVLTGHDGCSRDVAFRPDGKQLASAGEDGTVRLWDVASRQLTAVLRGSSDLYRLAYSADGRLLAAGGGDKAVRVWEVETHKEIGAYHPGSTVYGLAFNPDGTRLACACADNTIRLWDPIRLREVVELRGHGAYVHAVAFSPDGTRLVSGSGDSTVRIWDTLPAQERASHRETR
jgi:WD40 repeat protein